MRGKGRTISVVREVAERQHGVFARRQLLALGVGSKLIDYWLETRRIDTVYQGVYAFSEALLSRYGRWLAAVLAVGPEAALSHRSAAALWGIRQQASGPVEITTRRKPKQRAEIRLHYLPLEADEVTVHDGIPVTTPGRTLFDIAHALRPHELEQAMREADYLRLTGGPSLPELAERYPGRTGMRAVRRLLDAGWSGAPTRRELEARFNSFIDEYEFRRPERNALIQLTDRRVEVDFLWRSARLVVELDGYAAHGTRHAFEDDRERDRLLQLAGFRVVRVTWRQLHGDPAALARDLRALLRS
jgi:very-short-patch-repair endonuclease/predicted transcriptional regulator of viral defense system